MHNLHIISTFLLIQTKLETKELCHLRNSLNTTFIAVCTLIYLHVFGFKTLFI